MKRIIRNISSCVLLALVMGACEEDAALVSPNVAHDKSTVSPEEVGETAFLQSASESGNKFIFLDFVEQGSDELYIELVEPAERDMTFTIGINTLLTYQDMPSIAEQFYKVEADFVEDWENKFTITNGGKVTVAAGERKSTRISFTVSNMELIGSYYLLPLLATDEDGNQYKLFYYICQVEMERQDRSNKPYTVVAYIDTEMMNPLIADQYTSKLQYMKSRRDRKTIYENVPVFDIVNLRKALLKYDESSRRAVLKFTPDIEHVLKNYAQYIQPLKRSGIKVCLSIEGGGTGIGFANLTDVQIADFVAQVQVAVKMYQLDGIHLRDEGAGYDKTGAPELDETSYPKLVKALREAMPDIMLTLADDGGTTAMMDKEQGGIVVGDYIDLAWNVVWDTAVNPWASGSERKPIAGVTKERYGGISFYIKPRMTNEEGLFFENLQDESRIIALNEGLGKVAVAENIPYRDYIQEVANVMGIMGLLSCFHDTNNGEYPRYDVNVTETLAASYYFAFRKDW